MKKYSERYHWLDVFKAFAIFFVIYYHLDSNRFTAYLNAFIVQPFFFASGVTAARSKRLTVADFGAKRFRQIMVPYFVFGAAAMVLKFFTENQSLATMAKQLLLGRRTDMFAVTLWFLPCLFIMSIIYHILIVNINSAFVRLAICAGVSFVFRLFSEGNMLPWGADNAIRFLVYYALGDAVSGYINRVSAAPLTENKLFVAAGTVSAVVSLLHYRRGFTFLIDMFGIPQVYFTLFMSMFFCACNAILMYTFISVLLQKCRLLQIAGRASISICCLQTIVDKLFAALLKLTGIGFVADTTAKILVLSVILIALSVLADALLKKLVPFIYGIKK